MTVMKYYLLLIVSLVMFVSVSAQEVKNLRTGSLKNPIGIDKDHPILSWIITSPDRNVKQVAYQILVASSIDKLVAGKADL